MNKLQVLEGFYQECGCNALTTDPLAGFRQGAESLFTYMERRGLLKAEEAPSDGE